MLRFPSRVGPPCRRTRDSAHTREEKPETLVSICALKFGTDFTDVAEFPPDIPAERLVYEARGGPTSSAVIKPNIVIRIYSRITPWGGRRSR